MRAQHLRLAISVFVFSVAQLATAADLRVNLRSCSTMVPQTLWKSAPSENPCAGKGTSLVGLVSSRLLELCVDGKSIANYDISIGRGGTGKTREGDLKTPIGIYSLGKVRASDRFGLFIPIGYPTASQRAEGFTGADVGLHGPNRPFACTGALNVAFNWTQGCLAVSSDATIVAIARFLKAHPDANRIHLIEN